MTERKFFIFFIFFYSVDVGPASEGECDSPGQMPCSGDWSSASVCVRKSSSGGRNNPTV